ncbi:hypothetical protein SAPIO_CDS2017 [Scedosporium apiospermum]|uniref:Major facilitator superfamily (MFS) profile domain-containing protein n=1 Tax=Pseudallescheria apiosperma TaxID=563466 RepID=A0A084GE90_PSEDA|nr:uncharacterized protein SAPIO_CDS2017 [Scedosporium apiospermum]KEZ45652.1 hypothetical protein SAPIO_CDS2017 [Scedosporium apiospermum]
MADKEAARSVHHVDLKEKFDNQSLVGKERRNGYQHLLTEEQEQFLNSVEPSEQDKIFRKAWNAKIEGLEADLGMSGTDYNLIAAIFFIPYLMFELPSNTLLLRFKRPSYYLGVIVTAWGLVMTCTGFVKNMGGLAACRALLGLFESGFFPAAVYLISKWYPPNRTYWRVAIFYSASAASGAFSGLLAAAIAQMDGVRNLEGWRWIFILEGVASVLIGLMCFFFLPDSPSLSKWLAPDEARFLNLLHDATRGRMEMEKKKADNRKTLVKVVKDWQLYVHALIFNGVGIPLYGVKFTMPQIVKNMGFASTKAQLMTAPPYAVAALASLLCAWFSDKYRWRMPFMVGPQVLTLVGFAILYVVSDKLKDNIALAYFCLFIVCAGTYPTLPGINSWSSDNLAGPAKRAMGLGFMIMMGNVSGFGGSYIFINKEAPKYPTAYGLSLGLLCTAVVASISLDYVYWTINKRRKAMTPEEISAEYTNEELDELGDRSPLFRYQL